MAKQSHKSTPNYKALYHDILVKKHPDKIENCQTILDKKELSILDVISLNQKIFGKSAEAIHSNQKYKTYDKKDILKILDHQKKYKLNNIETAKHFNLSRNTVAKWKKMFV